MESPTLSRTPSSLFSPGPHRRSHPNLQHLSLAPLTPKYPVDPSDYDAYFDPSTSKLHTSTSLSNINGLPSPDGILTNSPARSRATSKTRLRRKAKSTVSIRAPGDLPSGALTIEGFGAKTTEGAAVSKSRLRLRPDSSWFTQTGLALTEGTRESKGQMWIAQRASSTSLQNMDQQPRSGRSTPNRSRRSSRTRRKELAMTAPSELGMVKTETDYKPDWADTQTQAEIAAELDREMADELEVGSEDEFFRDRYGMLNFDDQFDSEDEKDVRDAVQNSGFRIGGWFDGVVDVFLKLDEEEALDLEAARIANVPPEATLVPVRSNVSVASDDSMEAPPERPQGVWDDVRWFGRVIARTVGS